MVHTTVILPTYNEADNIVPLIEAIFAACTSCDVLVMDDNSPDETWRLVQEMGDPRVKLIRRIGTRGLASALNRGIIESRGEIVGWLDADQSMPPSVLAVMIEKLREFDVAIGSRYVPGGKDDRPPMRVWASRLINRTAGLVLGYGILDYDSGFIALRRTVFDRVSIIPTGYGAYFIEFLFTCRRKGLTVCEVPYVFHDRLLGVSKSNPTLWDFFITGIGYVVRIAASRLRPPD